MACGKYEVIKEGEDIILRIDCSDCPFFPSLEDEPRVMQILFDALLEVGVVTQIVFVQKRDFEYDEAQTSMLVELAGVYKKLVKDFPYNLVTQPACERWVRPKYVKAQTIFYETFKSDPIGAYVELKRLSREEKLEEERLPVEGVACLQPFWDRLADAISVLENTRLIQLAKPHLAGFKPGDRSIYRILFSPTIRPDFMFTKLMAAYPSEGEEISSYQVGDNEVTIFKLPESVQYLYHVVPAEFKLDYEKYELLDAARNVLAEHQPKRSEFVDPERMRAVFTAIGNNLLEELAERKNIHLRVSEREALAEILVRYTVGFGLLEVLLADDKVQDITVNSPMGRIPIF
ncbi:hypothetical protein D6825_04030, partial [Candidatus Woesearchaeota archaeon]